MTPSPRTVVRRLASRRSVKDAAQTLAAARSPAAHQLSRALTALHVAPSPAAEEWFARVEQLRARLERSSDELTVVSYGAGSPSASKTPEEMAAGSANTRTVGSLCASASKPPVWGRLLFHLVHEREPATALELGTCLGISAAYQAGALRRHGGRLVTLEGSPEPARLATANLRELGLDNVDVRVGRFQDELGPALAELGAVSHAFIDGHHDETATLEYFERIAPHLTAGATVVFDDIDWSDGMRRAWRTILEDARTDIGVDLGDVGVAVVGAAGPDRVRVAAQVA